MRFLKSLYLSKRFFILYGAVMALFCLGFAVHFLFYVAQGLLVLATLIVLFDVIWLFSTPHSLEAVRRTPKVLSLGSDNPVHIDIRNKSKLSLNIKLIDELPYQLQIRDFEILFQIKPMESKELNYILRPLLRGEYNFGNIIAFSGTVLGLVERRHKIIAKCMVPVYPSILQMRQFELLSIQRISTFYGIKKQRRIGQSYEFEQIKNYVRGDDYRKINWKATSRKSDLMVNHYEEEKSQQVYSIIDSSRSMLMPFNGLSLLDYSVNTSLVLSNIALQKQDKTGVISFAEKIDTVVKADQNPVHIRKILEGLYRVEESTMEANYELLYLSVRNIIRNRSLLFLYTNFESYFALERMLPIIKKLNKRHLLVVVFFENTEVLDYSMTDAKNMEEIYYKTIAQKYAYEKRQIINELRQYGIQAILTRPENLTISSVNKYLELKSRGLI